MTTSAGARCDHCSRVELLDSPHDLGMLPDGWYALHGPTPGGAARGVVVERRDYCSLKCVQEATMHAMSAFDAAVRAETEAVAEKIVRDQLYGEMPVWGLH